VLPEPLVGELPEQGAEIHVKGAYLSGARHVVLKLATGFPANRERGLPSGDGLFLLLDAETGVPDLLLLEHGYLTDLRTAAAIALTLRYLAPDVPEALLLGAGAVGRIAARAIIAERPFRRLTIWNRTPERAQSLAAELAGAVETRVAEHLEPEVRRHRVIITATSATFPIVRAPWVQKGTHITSAGTGSPEKVELEPALLAKADKLIADRVVQTAKYGNLHHAIAAGLLTSGQVFAELGDLAAGRARGRERPDEITIADLTGVGVQDAGIAQAVVETLDRALPRG
jgi:ornithine cyclodeaminase